LFEVLADKKTRNLLELLLFFDRCFWRKCEEARKNKKFNKKTTDQNQHNLFSNGGGRSGAFLALDANLELLRQTGQVDVYVSFKKNHSKSSFSLGICKDNGQLPAKFDRLR
jgi:hypothetical protein